MRTVYIAMVGNEAYQLDGAFWADAPDICVYNCTDLRTHKKGYTAYSPILKRFFPFNKNGNDVAVMALMAELKCKKRQKGETKWQK